jgi:AraC family transcriptional regulator
MSEVAADLMAEHEAAVSRAIAAMRDSLFDVVRLDDHAAAGMYSRFHFHRVFRQVTGTTPARFLAGLRMQQAKHLLASTEHTVTTISGLVGYESLGTFTTQFGRLVGVPPGRFRQLVDWCAADRRLGQLDLPTGTPDLRMCRRSAAVNRPDWTTFVGLFPDGQPAGAPAAMAIVPCMSPELRHRLGRTDPSMAALAVSVPGWTRLVDLAVGQLDESWRGQASARVCDDLTRDAVHLHLRPSRPVDPPMVSAAVVQYLFRLVG